MFFIRSALCENNTSTRKISAVSLFSTLNIVEFLLNGMR